jgi:hypothetical protein
MIPKYAVLTIGVTLTVPVSAPILPGEHELIDTCKSCTRVCYEIRFDRTPPRLGGPGATKPDGRAGSPRGTTDSPSGLPESP